MEKDKAQNGKVQQDDEISTEELEQVSGGTAVDYFLKIDGIKGDSTALKINTRGFKFLK